jgi:serine/threonine protein kinase
MKTYKYGVASFVELGKFKAVKHMKIEEMYWTKEYSTLLYLWKHKHSNIIRYESGSYLERPHPMFDDSIGCFLELTFPKYQKTLGETAVYIDKGIIQIMIDLLSAIKLCHSLNIWHRDIKLENILIQDGRATLIDFTHAVRIRSSNIVLDYDVATYSHRAPEVFKYRRKKVAGYTEKIDVWALGVILFEMVINDNMYTYLTQDNNEDDLDNFFNRNFPRKMQLIFKKIYVENKNTALSHSLVFWTWIIRMLSYVPDSRVSASEMLDIIVRFATVNDIEFVMPTSREITPTIRIYDKPNFEQSQILVDVFNLVHIINQAYCINIKTNRLVPIYKMLIVTGTINRENMRQTTLATYMLVTNVIYDCCVDVDDVISMLLNANSELHFEKQPLILAMIHIMQNNETDLFLHDTF